MKFIFMAFVFKLLVFSPLISDFANAQVQISLKDISDRNICTSATYRNRHTQIIEWHKKIGFRAKYVNEAERRGLACTADYEKKDINNKNNSSSTPSWNLSNYSDWRVCDEADQGKPEWIEEASRRQLKCGSSTNISTFLSGFQNNIICNRANEGKSDYLLEAKRRGLACGVENNKNNSSSAPSWNLSNYSDWRVCDEADQGNPEWIKEAKSRGLSCGVKNPLSGVEDNRVCNKASEGAIEYILEAKRRGLNECIDPTYNLFIKEREEEERRKRYFLINLSDNKVCERAIITKRKPGTYDYIYAWNKNFGPYIEEAKRRGLNCGVKENEVEKKRIAEEKVLKQKEIQEKLEKEKRINEEQEKIRKKAEEKALKKKIADEKARKIAEKKAKIEAQKREEEAKKLKNKITTYKNEATFYYQDITEFVKSGAEIDLVKLTELFSKRPDTNKKWNKEDTKNYENLKSYLNSNQAFVNFQKSKKEARIAKANADKNNTINSLNNNLKKLNSLLRENFDNDKVIKIIQSNIKKTKSILDGNFNQKKANKVLNDVNGYLSNYFDNKNKLKELNNYLNNKKLALTDIIKNNFGTEEANIASKFISDIEKTKTVESKKQLKDKIDIFIKNPSEGIKKIKKKAEEKALKKKIADEKARKILEKINKDNALKQKFSDLLDNQICNRAVQNNEWIPGNKDLIAEAKRRGLDCGVKTSSNSKFSNLKNKVKDKASKYVKKELGPCSNVTGGWGKTKCLALLNKLPIEYACVGLLTNQGYDGVLNINIKGHDQILFNFDGLVKGKVKGQDNNLLGKGTFKFSYFKMMGMDMVVKIKIGLLGVEYEQTQNGRYYHSGYCKERL